MSFLQQIGGEEAAMVARNLQRHAQAYSIPQGTASANRVGIMGRNGYIFIGDGANQWEQQLFGRVPLAQDWALQWRQVLITRHQTARQAQLKLAHLVMPEKQIVLPDLRWNDSIGQDFAERPFRKIPWDVAGPAVPVYPAQNFTAARAWSPVYWHGNSHCTPSGCLVAAQMALDAFAIDEPLGWTNTAVEPFTTPHDLSSHFHGDPPSEESLRIRRPGETVFHRDMREVNGSFTGSQYVLRNAAAKIDGRLAIFGDSYAWDAGLGDIMGGVFREVHFVWSKDILWNYIGKHAISHVLWESAERFLIRPPRQ